MNTTLTAPPILGKLIEHLEQANNFLCLNLTPPQGLTILGVIVFGLIIGSFLNVVIYRGSSQYLGSKSPKEGPLTISSPKSSFCPDCLHSLSWAENIPLISWLLQGGKCKHCKAPISLQYPLVEATNAALWVLAYTLAPSWGHFLVGALTISLLIAAAGIDIKTSKIPNKLTLSGTLMLLALGALATPQQLLTSLAGMATGFAAMFLIIQLGKLLFGRKTVKMKEPVPFAWDSQRGILKIQDEGKSLEESEPIYAHEIFTRKSDYIEMEADLKNNKGKERRETLKINSQVTYLIDKTSGEKTELIPIPNQSLSGKIKTITFPREAMGMGDAKLMAMIGAGIGMIPALQTIVIAACAGAVVGITMRLIAAIGKKNPPSTMVFGPWLAAAAILILIQKYVEMGC